MSVHPSILLEHLGLDTAAVAVQRWLDRAAQEELSYADFLEGLLEEEVVARKTAATERRLREAGFPYAASIEQFDFRFRPDLKRQLVLRYFDAIDLRKKNLSRGDNQQGMPYPHGAGQRYAKEASPWV